MKLPLDLGVKLFFRLLVPGFFLTLGIFPLLFGLLDAVGLPGQQEVAFVLATILVGWMIVAADMPIYMLLEGRRYWPPILWRRLVKSQQRHLARLNRHIDRFYSAPAPSIEEKRLYLECSVEKRSFPLASDGERYAAAPTRLGNTILAYESYPSSRYGFEAVFYWPRIWVNLSKDLREEIDNQQAMADGAVYSTFALGATGLLWMFYGIAAVLARPLADALARWGVLGEPLPAGIFRHLPGVLECLLVAVVCLFVSRIIYRLSIFTNEQFGTVFMAVVDSHAEKLASEYVAVDVLAAKISATVGVGITGDEKLDAVRRYLQYFNVKLPGRPRPVPFPQAAKILSGPVEPLPTQAETVEPHDKGMSEASVVAGVRGELASKKRRIKPE